MVLDLMLLYKIVLRLCSVTLSDITISYVSCNTLLRNEGLGLRKFLIRVCIHLHTEHAKCGIAT